MTLEELIPAWRKWGNTFTNVVRVRKNILKSLNLPATSKQFLNLGGLVNVYHGMMTPTLPRLTELVTETGPLPAFFARYRVLGELGFCMFQCLDEEENGQVVVAFANPEQEKSVLFSNSSILHFAECCIALDKIWDEEIEQGHAHFPSPKWDNFIARYEQAIRDIDPPALEDEKTWYARDVKDLKAGIY